MLLSAGITAARSRARSQREEGVTTEVLSEGLQGGGLDVLTAYVE